MLTEDEFWSGREQQSTVRFSIVADNQQEGMRPNINRLLHLTAQDRENILKTYPSVRRKMEETVPDKITERDFWQLFLCCQRIIEWRGHETN